MSGRLLLAIISTIIEEAALTVIFLVGLPEMDINPPLWLMFVVLTAWAGMATLVYRAGTRALDRKPVIGLSSMVGGRGVVVSPLSPVGLVRVKNELWAAKTEGSRIDSCEEIVVVGQKRMRLTVERAGQSKGRML
ncbi:MAG: NfeD family protein [Dehalococcoidales bacterium]